MEEKKDISTATGGAVMGKRGGCATGKCKRRGGPEYYAAIARKSAEVRRANAKAKAEIQAKGNPSA